MITYIYILLWFTPLYKFLTITLHFVRLYAIISSFGTDRLKSKVE